MIGDPISESFKVNREADSVSVLAFECDLFPVEHLASLQTNSSASSTQYHGKSIRPTLFPPALVLFPFCAHI
jgi:hypothetical protein